MLDSDIEEDDNSEVGSQDLMESDEELDAAKRQAFERDRAIRKLKADDFVKDL